MADLPSKLDRLLEILEIIAEEEQMTTNQLAKKLNTKIGSIKLYLEYLEEMGLIYRWKEGRRTWIKITADMVAKIGDTMMAVVDGKAIVWRCPFTDVCPYYEQGCTSANKCIFLSAFVPVVQEEIRRRSQEESQIPEDGGTE